MHRARGALLAAAALVAALGGAMQAPPDPAEPAQVAGAALAGEQAPAHPAARPPAPPRGPLPLALGTNLEGMRDLRALGAQPELVLLWAGAWNLEGWDQLREDLAEVRAAGSTPVVQWYYWGEDIAPDAVERGVRSGAHGVVKSRPLWDALTMRLGQVLAEELGSLPAMVVLEGEFNKHGVERWEAFDGILAEQASRLRAAAPHAKVVLGFGGWGLEHWGRFDRAAAASDLVGFQALRSLARGGEDRYREAPAQLLRMAEHARDLFGKPSLVVDAAFGTHGAGEGMQAQAVGSLLDLAPELAAAGVVGIVYRAWRDAGEVRESRFHGAAERTWGLADGQGRPKPAGLLFLDALAARATLSASGARPAAPRAPPRGTRPRTARGSAGPRRP